MKKLLIFTLLIYCCNFISGQKLFDKGYFIDSTGVKTECLIKNYDRQNNPSKIEIKRSDSDKIETYGIHEISEFCIYGYGLYKRFEVNIDSSAYSLNLSERKNPDWKKMTIFLKVLVQGKANLYSFTKLNQTLFFFTVNDSQIQQLIYKEYTQHGQSGVNNGFRQQLLALVNNGYKTADDVSTLQYNELVLVKYFNDDNGINPTKSAIKKIRREIFNLKITPGIEFSKPAVEHSLYYFGTIQFNKTQNYRIGLETEVFFPFYKNRFSFLFEPTYQQLNTSLERVFYGNTTLHYETIDFPIGIRYYQYFDSNNRIFLNVNFAPNISVNFNSFINYGFVNFKMDLTPSPFFSFGAGYDFKNIGFEFKCNLNRDLLSKYVYWDTDFQKVSFIVRYKFYKHSN